MSLASTFSRSFWLPESSLHHRSTYIICTLLKMAAAFPKGFNTTYKRARSQDSPTPLASPPVLKVTKLEDETVQDESSLPCFLRQSQDGKLLAVGAYASMHYAAILGSSTNVTQKFGPSFTTWHGRRNFVYSKVELILILNGRKT